jgi:RHS repeat-associated protein
MRISLKNNVASDLLQILCEYTADTTCRQWFTYGNTIDEVLSRNEHPYGLILAMQYYAHDHLYSPAALANYNGFTVWERYEYDAYGKVTITGRGADSTWYTADDVTLSASAYHNPFTFTGRQLDILDAGNLHHMHYRHRDYSPTLGRFLQHDPLGITDAVERSLNYLNIPNFLMPLIQYYDALSLYEYGRSNSLLNTDSLGLDTQGEYKNCLKECDLRDDKCTVRGILVCAAVGVKTGGIGGIICGLVYFAACDDAHTACQNYCDQVKKWKDSGCGGSMPQYPRKGGGPNPWLHPTDNRPRLIIEG